MVLTGSCGFTTTTLGKRMMPATGSASRRKLKLSFSLSYSVALTALAGAGSNRGEPGGGAAQQRGGAGGGRARPPWGPIFGPPAGRFFNQKGRAEPFRQPLPHQPR